MPKIIFRPNPTPPPFVPPTPPTPTTITLSAYPMDFNPDTGLNVKFDVRPDVDFDYCNIQNEDSVIGTVYTDDYFTDDFYQLNVESSGSLPFEGLVTFYSNGEVVLELPLSAHYIEP